MNDWRKKAKDIADWAIHDDLLPIKERLTRKIEELAAQAYESGVEDAAKVADNFHFSLITIDGTVRVACMPGVCYCSEEKLNAAGRIATVIRQLSRKGEV